ncbi:ankyrin repeat domain-containing protein 26 isoform X5 [Prionailurus iriomotensis]
MKRIFGFGSKKGVSPLGSASVGQKNNRIDNFLMGYHVRDRDLGKIHKAAYVGNVAKVQQILFLGKNGVDDRDKMNRKSIAANSTEEKQCLVEKHRLFHILCHQGLIIINFIPQIKTMRGALGWLRRLSVQLLISAQVVISQLSDKPGIDDSWPTSDSEDLDFGTKNVPKPSVAKLLHSSGQFMKNMRAKRGSVKAEGGTLSEDNDPDSENEDVGETLSKPPTRDYGDSLPIFPSAKSLLKPSLKTLAVLGLPKEGTAKSAVEAKEDGIGIIENVPPEQTVNDSLTSGGVHKNYRSDMMSALGLGEEEDVESPSDPESMSESPNKYVPHLSGAVDQKGQSILNGQVEDKYPPDKYPHLKPTVEVEDSFSDKTVGMKDIQTSRSDFSDWESTSLTFGNETCQTSKNLKVDDKCPFVSQPMIKNQSASTDSGPITLVDREKINIGTVLLLGNCTLHDLSESQLPENRESKEADLDLELTSVEERERLDGSENNHPQGTLFYTVGFLKIQDIVLSYERLMKLNKSHCKLLTGKIKQMEKTVSALQNELREAKDMKSRLEHQKVEWEHEFCSLRFTLKQEEEKRRNADMLYEKIRERLRRKEDQYNKEVETKQQFELALRTLNMELKAAKNHLNQVVEKRTATEFESGSCRTPLVSTDDSILNQDLVWKASQEYVHILNKNYMI